MVLQLHCLPAIHAPWCYTVRHAAPSVSGWSTNSYLHIFPQGKDLAMRLFAWLCPFSDPTYPRSWDFIRPRVAALPSQPLPTRRTLFTLSSFRALLPSALPPVPRGGQSEVRIRPPGAQPGLGGTRTTRSAAAAVCGPCIGAHSPSRFLLGTRASGLLLFLIPRALCGSLLLDTLQCVLRPPLGKILYRPARFLLGDLAFLVRLQHLFHRPRRESDDVLGCGVF